MENFNPAEVAQKIMDKIQSEYKDLKKLNVMILGKTGVGKSTLINNMFSQNVAETGIGKPVTDEIRKYEKPDFPLAIYDTPGVELSGENAIDQLLNEAIGVIKDGIRSRDISQAIHCIWYCVSTPSHRFEASEIEFLKRFLDETELFSVPVILVMTQSYSRKDTLDLKREIEKENLAVVNVIPVLAEDYPIDEMYTAKAYGLDHLSQVMYTVIPEAVQKTFVAVQTANIDLKKGKAQAVVAASASAAAATGAVPIPFSDAALLVPEQIAMLAGITVVFGVPVEKASLIAIISATIGTAGTTVLGKTVVSGLLKLIPGVGSVIGGTISGATAAALTTALGEAYIALLIRVMKGEITLPELQSKEGMKKIADLFHQYLSLKRDGNGKEEK
ncbi:MAG: 50S ribosome-binding GTPase [Clostridia bacterium]|nr:50S ribosome-binding GTPase [Clostridia bacterium]